MKKDKGSKFICVDAIPCIDKEYRRRLKSSKIYEMPNDNYDVFAAYTTWTPVDFELFPNLEVILCPCTNINHLQPIPLKIKTIYLDDPKALFENVYSTSEWVITNTFNLLRKDDLELSNKSVGFVGYGRVGQQVARFMSGFNTKMYYYDTQVTPLYYANSDIEYCPNIEDLMAVSDIVILAITANSVTKDIVNFYHFEYLKAKKKRIYLVNVSRASVLHGPALVKNLKNGVIKGFATDVIEAYDGDLITELYRLERDKAFYNISITPHIAGTGKYSREWTDRYVLDRFYEHIEKYRKDLLK